MFDMSLGEMLVIGVLVLVFFSPEQLPDLMRHAGRLYGQVRGASDDLRRAFNAEVARVDADRRRDELQRRREEMQRRRAEAGEAESPPRRPTAAPDAVPRPPVREPPRPLSEPGPDLEAPAGAPAATTPDPVEKA